MAFIILKASSYLLMIIVAFMFKKIGLLKKEHGKALSYLIMRFTLPAAIITSFASVSFESSFLYLIIFGFLGNLILMIVGFAITKRKSRNDKILYTANIGYNVGNFTLPFTSSFFGPAGIISTCLFDAGNAILFLGLNYPIVEAALDKGKKISILRILKKLFSSPSFDAYLLMVMLGILKIRIPEAVSVVTSEIGKANGPMAMFMIGTMLELNFDKKYLAFFAKMFTLRSLVAVFMSLIIYKLTFLPFEAVKAGIIACWSPMGSLGPAYTAYHGGDVELASFANTMSIFASLIIIPTLAIVL